MARTKVTPQQGKKDAKTRILQARAATKVEEREKRASLPVHPLLQPKRPLYKQKRIAEAEQLEGIGRSPSLLPTQQLAKMAAEAWPSMLGKEEPARRKL